MYPISTCSSSSQQKHISRLGSFGELVNWKHPKTSTEDNHVAHIAFIKVNCTVDGWYSHVVSVAPNTSNNPSEHVLRMLDSLRKFLIFIVEWTKP